MKLSLLIMLSFLVAMAMAMPSSEDNPEIEPWFEGPVQNVTVAQGRDALLSCTINNLGTYRAAWIKMETKAILTIHLHVITRNYRISLSHSDNRHFNLHIRNVQKWDKGGYMCQVNTVPMKSEVGFLDVLVPPDILVNESSSDVIAREGSNVSLRCRSEGYPLPSITWRREDNDPIPLGSWQGKKHLATAYEGDDLSISRVSRLHMGAYLCIASNGVPPSVSRRIYLHVHFSPVMWIPNQLIGARIGGSITLNCHAEAYPASINYWARDASPRRPAEGNDVSGKEEEEHEFVEQVILSNQKYHIDNRERMYKTHMRLTISDIQPEDFVIYKCFAKNSLGSTEGSIKLYELPPSTSEPSNEVSSNRLKALEGTL